MLTIGLVSTIWVVTLSASVLALLPYENKVTGNLLVTALILFNAINLFVCMGEIILGLQYNQIKVDSKKKQANFPINNLQVIADYGGTKITLRQVFNANTWAGMWSTYAVYDDSYSNCESFGFFIDVGNGWSTAPPCLLLLYSMIHQQSLDKDSMIASPLIVGCVVLASNWQMLYGTIIYFLSYVYNKRYVGQGVIVPLFVFVLNGIWMFFPTLAMYAAVQILKHGNFHVFSSSAINI